MYLELLKKCLTAYIYPESGYREVQPRPDMGIARRIVSKALAKRGYKLLKVVPFDSHEREVGKDWPWFGYSMIGLRRLSNLQDCVETVLAENVPGDLMESGVWRGGACILMRAVLKAHDVRDRSVYLADSFAGLPAPTHEADHGYDLSKEKYLAVSAQDVRMAFEKFDVMDDQVKFLEGWFKDTLPTAPINRLALLRLDGDLYESTMDVLTSVYDKVSTRGFIIVDDYHTWPPCKQAV